jgi:hypothetical protein
MIFWLILAALAAVFVAVPVFTAFPAGSDQEHVVEHRASAAKLTSVAGGMYHAAALARFFFDMLLSRGATGADPERARVAREHAEAVLDQVTRLWQASNLAQYGVENAARGSVAEAVVAATKVGVSASTTGLQRIMGWCSSAASFFAELTGIGPAVTGAARGLVSKVAELESKNDSGAAQDFCARVAQVAGFGLVTVFGASMTCDEFALMPSVMRFAAILIAVTFLTLSYFSAPDQKWSEVGRGTVASIRQHTLSTSVALAATLAPRIVACAFAS